MKAIRCLLVLFLGVSTAAIAVESKIGSPAELGKALEAGFKEKDLAILDRTMDLDALLDRCLHNLPGSDKEKKEFRTGFRKGFTSNSSLRKAIESADDFKFLRVRKMGTNDTLLFRVITQGGINYYEYVLEPREGGELAIVDVHIFIMGELLSQTVRRVALAALAQKPGFLDRLLGNEADFVRYGKEIKSLSQYTQKQEHEKVLATVRKLPESLQNQKFVLIQKLGAAAEVDEAEYRRTIEQWEKLFPRDPSLPLISIDGYVLRKDYDAAIKMLETLNSTIGGDPYIRVLQAGQYGLKGDKARARTSAEQALKAEPTLASAVDFLLGLNLEEKRFADVSKLLLDFEKVSGADMAEAIKEEEAYAEFRSSSEYKKFLDARRKLRSETEKPSAAPKAAAGPLEPESRFIVRISDKEVACDRPDGKTERVTWKDLQRVEVMTTSEGPAVADVFWILHGTDSGCAIPQGATGEKELLDRLQALPGFDNKKVIEAMSSTSDQRFLCWQKAPRSGR